VRAFKLEIMTFSFSALASPELEVLTDVDHSFGVLGLQPSSFLDDVPELEVLTDIDHFFEVLGLQRSSTLDDVKLAFNRHALTHHPDKALHGKDNAKQAFQNIHAAYEGLVEHFQVKNGHNTGKKRWSKLFIEHPDGWAKKVRRFEDKIAGIYDMSPLMLEALCDVLCVDHRGLMSRSSLRRALHVRLADIDAATTIQKHVRGHMACRRMFFLAPHSASCIQSAQLRRRWDCAAAAQLRRTAAPPITSEPAQSPFTPKSRPQMAPLVTPPLPSGADMFSALEIPGADAYTAKPQDTEKRHIVGSRWATSKECEDSVSMSDYTRLVASRIS